METLFAHSELFFLLYHQQNYLHLVKIIDKVQRRHQTNEYFLMLKVGRI